MLAVLSVVASAIGVAIVMGRDPSAVDFMRAGVCFMLAVGISLVEVRVRQSRRRH